MNTVALVVLLIAGVSAQYFCPETEADLQCLETMGDVAFCMDDGTWNCGKCDTKRDVCFNNLKIARFESTCTRAGNVKPDCLSAA